MDKVFDAQIQHIRRCVASLRLFDLAELQRRAKTAGTDEERALIAAVLAALETLPQDRH